MQKEGAIGALDHARSVRAQRDEFGLHVIQAKTRRAKETSVIAGLLVSQRILPVSDGGRARAYYFLHVPKTKEIRRALGGDHSGRARLVQVPTVDALKCLPDFPQRESPATRRFSRSDKQEAGPNEPAMEETDEFEN